MSALVITIVTAAALGWGLSEAQHVKKDWNRFFATGLQPIDESAIVPVQR